MASSTTHHTSSGLMKQLDNYLIVDVGANLTNKKFSRDLDSVVQRAKESGVSKIMVTGTSLTASKDALRLSRLYPGVLYGTAGIHPHDAKSWDEESMPTLRELLQNRECVAVGECGLDFNRNFSPPETQLEVFEKQIQLACEIRKPLFLHERDAHKEMVNLLTQYKDNLPTCVIHCFTGTKEQARTYIEMGCYIGLTGYLWKDKSQTFLQRYCTFQRNEPCSLPVTVEMIAAYLKKSPEEIALATTFNALKVFGLSA
ncbi:hypothetical protein TCAL_14908 [Tigriopus californicus]|uniref:Deoxyribonuclease TATDN1 n=1 Tax=Tigriopus californicus TaxID=6832 RepID=A0A553P419_TIGCA|nr:hypothetical protein TCAL_14908 [Tigriopus californicus]